MTALKPNSVKAKINKVVIILLIVLSLPIQAQDLTSTEKTLVLSGVIQNLEKLYPFPEVAEKTIAGLNTQISDGTYERYTSHNEFASKVTSSLEEFSNDKHLDLFYDTTLAKTLLDESEYDAINYTEEEAKTEVWNNYGFKELSILDGNVGYLRLDIFFATDYAGKSADIALSYFANCNALIIDLRQNGGGWDQMVNYLLGYFLDTSEPILRDISQSTVDSSYYSATISNYVPGKKLTDIPIYILISHSTASAAEAFASHMKYYNKNTTLVGLKTKGAENPVTDIAINENYILQIPVWKKIYSNNPEVWEGVGIQPDIEIASKDAKRIAHLKALEKLIKTTDDKTAINKYQWAIDGLNSSYDNADLKNIKKYVGNYDKIKIIYKEGKLYYQYNDRPINQLIPISDYYFVVEGIDYFRLKFVTTESNIIMHQIFTYGVVREISKEK